MLYRIWGLFFLGIRGPGSGPGGISQTLVPIAILMLVLSSIDISTPMLCKFSSLIWDYSFAIHSFGIKRAHLSQSSNIKLSTLLSSMEKEVDYNEDFVDLIS